MAGAYVHTLAGAAGVAGEAGAWFIRTRQQNQPPSYNSVSYTLGMSRIAYAACFINSVPLMIVPLGDKNTIEHFISHFTFC